MRLQTCKKGNGLVHCSVENAREEEEEKEEEKEEEEERKKNILADWQLSGLVLLQCYLVLLGVLFVMKTLKDEW